MRIGVPSFYHSSATRAFGMQCETQGDKLEGQPPGKVKLSGVNMGKYKPRVPIGLPIAVVVTLILGLIAGPLINSLASEEQMAQNVLLNAIPFILIFVSIILAFITIIWAVATTLNNNISKRTYSIIEGIIIAGIVLGILGMFQPWIHAGFKYGFLLLLISTLSFILWSHVTPKFEESQAEPEIFSVS